MVVGKGDFCHAASNSPGNANFASYVQFLTMGADISN